MDLQQLLGPVIDAARAVRAQALDLATGMGRPGYREAMVEEVRVGLRVLPSVAPWLVRSRPEGTATLLTMARQHAERHPYALAVEMGDERLSWSQLVELAARIARALERRGLRQGEVVALLGPNSPFYIAATLAATHLGAVAALINTHLHAAPLTHALRTSGARLLVVHHKLEGAARQVDNGGLEPLVYGPGPFDAEVARADAALPPAEPRSGDDFVYIYTSGTTGMPKPSKVTHGRAVLIGLLVARGLWDFQLGDKLYCVLPLYHSSGLLLGVGACLAAGVPVALRESFSARAFWSEARRYNATAMLYIGEICRHLLHTPPGPDDRRHRIRVAVGNGMRADVWEAFTKRFGVAHIREFYGATEAPGGIPNLTGRPGSVGRLPLRHLLPVRLARYDVDADRHARDQQGFCVECAPGEVGELLVRLADAPLIPAMDFRGYTDPEATQKKILTDVFRKGDRYYRSGDLLRVDEDGYFYFVDRIGDTFRWKGENVSTTEVAEALGHARGVRSVAVLGVQVPGMEGQAGLAAVDLTPDADPDAALAALWAAAQTLPAYAQPRFVRLAGGLHTTSTHKIQKTALRSEGVDPRRVGDPLYVRTDDGYIPLTPARWDEVKAGKLRL